MKGVVFTVLNRMVEEKFGLDVWDELIERTKPPSGGAYTSGDVYDDAEALAYVGALSEMTGTPANDLLRAFGEYMLGEFARAHPAFFANHTPQSLLQSVHGVIHVEVKKLHPDALLPQFEYQPLADRGLAMLYRSPRKLCSLAEGLIVGTAEHFGKRALLTHPVCMRRGADHCRLEVHFVGR